MKFLQDDVEFLSVISFCSNAKLFNFAITETSLLVFIIVIVSVSSYVLEISLFFVHFSCLSNMCFFFISQWFLLLSLEPIKFFNSMSILNEIENCTRCRHHAHSTQRVCNRGRCLISLNMVFATISIAMNLTAFHKYRMIEGASSLISTDIRWSVCEQMDFPDSQYCDDDCEYMPSSISDKSSYTFQPSEIM